MREQSSGALAIILIILRGRALLKKKQNCNTQKKMTIFFSASEFSVWNSLLPKLKWAVSTSPLKKTAAAPTAMNTLTRIYRKRSHWAGETVLQMCRKKTKYQEKDFLETTSFCLSFLFKANMVTLTEQRVKTSSPNTTWARRSTRPNMWVSPP